MFGGAAPPEGGLAAPRHGLLLLLRHRAALCGAQLTGERSGSRRSRRGRRRLLDERRLLADELRLLVSRQQRLELLQERVRLVTAFVKVAVVLVQLRPHGGLAERELDVTVRFPRRLDVVVVELDGKAVSVENRDERLDAVRVVVPPASVHIRAVFERHGRLGVALGRAQRVQIVVGGVGAHRKRSVCCKAKSLGREKRVLLVQRMSTRLARCRASCGCPQGYADWCLAREIVKTVKPLKP